MNIEELEKSKCYGCNLCQTMCPRSAITSEESIDGFSYPSIDKELCNDCGLCYRLCPALNTHSIVNTPTSDVYSAVCTDKEILKNSTSGGVFATIAKSILSNGGIVYGAAFDSQLELRHLRVENLVDLPKLQKSKYLQSSCSGIFLKIRNDIENGKTVLFSGTPCQVAAVKNFIPNSEKLLLIDIICHGVNSPSIFRQYIAYCNRKYKQKITSIDFRSKKVGWNIPMTRLEFSNKTYKYQIFDLNPFIAMFRKNIFLRNCCYHCRFASISRSGDLSLGDFWGSNQKEYRKDGISIVLVNNSKGAGILQLLTGQLKIQKQEVGYVITHNPQLKSPSSISLRNLLLKKTVVTNIAKGTYDLVFEKNVFGYPFPLLRKIYYGFKFIKKRVANGQ